MSQVGLFGLFRYGFRRNLTLITMATRPKNPVPNSLDEPITKLRRSDAARYLGVSLASVKRFEKEGLLHGEKDGKGVHWFDMGQIEALKAERAGQPAPESEALVATIDGAGTLAKEAGKHTERILNLVLDPAESLLELYRETCKDLRAELEKVRGEYFELLKSMGEILKAQRQEDLEQYRMQLSDKRKEQALGLVRQAVPLLIAQAGGNKQLGQLLTFVQGLHPDQLRILVGSGLLTESQLQALSLVLTEDQKRGLAEQQNTSAQETPEESNSDAP